MFEQTLLETSGPLKSPWALTASFAGQALALSAFILASLIQTDSLPKSIFSIGLTAPIPRGAPDPPPSHPRTTRPQTSTQRVFAQPAIIPRIIDMTVQEAAPNLVADSAPGAIVGGSNTGPGLNFNVGDEIPYHAAPPPRAEPVAPPRSASPAPAKPVRVSEGVQAAKLISQVKPIYPQLAINMRLAGTVRLLAVIGRDGAIANLQVASGHPLLVPAAIDAVKQWRYRPTLLNNEPVEVFTTVEVNFTLGR